MDIGGVLKWPPDVYGGLFCAALVGVLSTFEILWPMRDIDRLLSFCKLRLLLAFASLVVFGGAAYFIVWVATVVGAVKFVGQDFWPWKALVAAGFAQALRLEVAGKAPLEGPHGLRAGLESYYGRILRFARCKVYKRLLDKHPKNNRLGDLVSVGLPKVYSLDETKLRFDSWLDTHCTATNRDARCDYLERVKQNASKGKTDLVKAGILWAGFASAESGDLSRALDFANERASSIVDLEAFR